MFIYNYHRQKAQKRHLHLILVKKRGKNKSLICYAQTTYPKCIFGFDESNKGRNGSKENRSTRKSNRRRFFILFLKVLETSSASLWKRTLSINSRSYKKEIKINGQIRKRKKTTLYYFYKEYLNIWYIVYELVFYKLVLYDTLQCPLKPDNMKGIICIKINGVHKLKEKAS